MARDHKTSTSFSDVAPPHEANDEQATIRDSRAIYDIFQADQKAEDEAVKFGQPLPYATPSIKP